jgi:hypothetical protein
VPFEEAKGIERATPVPQLLSGGGHRSQHMQTKKRNRKYVVFYGELF